MDLNNDSFVSEEEIATLFKENKVEIYRPFLPRISHALSLLNWQTYQPLSLNNYFYSSKDFVLTHEQASQFCKTWGGALHTPHSAAAYEQIAERTNETLWDAQSPINNTCLAYNHPKETPCTEKLAFVCHSPKQARQFSLHWYSSLLIPGILILLLLLLLVMSLALCICREKKEENKVSIMKVPVSSTAITARMDTTT